MWSGRPLAETQDVKHVIDSIHGILEHLEASSCAFALVGGLAVSARVEPRTTRDVDVAVSVDDDSAAEGLLREIIGRGYRVAGVVEQTETGRLATARLLPPRDAAAIVDLLFASCGIEPELVAAAEPLEILPGRVVPVATIGDLLAMKILSRDDVTRPQDAVDIRGLVACATEADLASARERVELITPNTM